MKKVITVFGNLVEERDSLAVRLVPELIKQLPDIEFKIQDPTENLQPKGDPWVILDVGEGIREVTVVEDLDQLEYVKSLSVHDYDVYMDLVIKDKLGQLPRIKIILVPSGMKFESAVAEVVELLYT